MAVAFYTGGITRNKKGTKNNKKNNA